MEHTSTHTHGQLASPEGAHKSAAAGAAAQGSTAGAAAGAQDGTALGLALDGCSAALQKGDELLLCGRLWLQQCSQAGRGAAGRRQGGAARTWARAAKQRGGANWQANGHRVTGQPTAGAGRAGAGTVGTALQHALFTLTEAQHSMGIRSSTALRLAPT